MKSTKPKPKRKSAATTRKGRGQHLVSDPELKMIKCDLMLLAMAAAKLRNDMRDSMLSMESLVVRMNAFHDSIKTEKG